MAEGGVDDCVDFYFLEGLFLDEVPEKYACPICLSPAQREAFLTQCCGKHFCLQCISRMVGSKPCPMCKSSPLVIFPNKERQREVNLLRVCCPTELKNDDDPVETSTHCEWTGDLGMVNEHLRSKHKEDKRWNACRDSENSAPNQQAGKATPKVCLFHLNQRLRQMTLGPQGHYHYHSHPMNHQGMPVSGQTGGSRRSGIQTSVSAQSEPNQAGQRRLENIGYGRGSENSALSSASAHASRGAEPANPQPDCRPGGAKDRQSHEISLSQQGSQHEESQAAGQFASEPLNSAPPGTNQLQGTQEGALSSSTEALSTTTEAHSTSTDALSTSTEAQQSQTSSIEHPQHQPPLQGPHPTHVVFHRPPPGGWGRPPFPQHQWMHHAGPHGGHGRGHPHHHGGPRHHHGHGGPRHHHGHHGHRHHCNHGHGHH